MYSDLVNDTIYCVSTQQHSLFTPSSLRSTILHRAPILMKLISLVVEPAVSPCVCLVRTCVGGIVLPSEKTHRFAPYVRMLNGCTSGHYALARIKSYVHISQQRRTMIDYTFRRDRTSEYSNYKARHRNASSFECVSKFRPNRFIPMAMRELHF